jgi:hypothetical protein
MPKCPECKTQVKKGTKLCPSCGTLVSKGSGEMCDLCATSLSKGDAKEVSASQMRIIAGNGYGRHVPVWPGMTEDKKKALLYQIAITNDTPWALCQDCYDETQMYAEDTGEGMDHDTFREVALKPLMDAMGGEAPRSPPPAPPRSDDEPSPGMIRGSCILVFLATLALAIFVSPWWYIGVGLSVIGFLGSFAPPTR